MLEALAAAHTDREIAAESGAIALVRAELDVARRRLAAGRDAPELEKHLKTLKSQWVREWEAATDKAPVTLVEANVSEHLKLYRTTTRGFLVVNDEQVLRDLDAIHRFAPEVEFTEDDEADGTAGEIEPRPSRPSPTTAAPSQHVESADAGSGATVTELFSQVRVERTESGGLRLEAEPEAAGELATLLEGLAGLLRQAADRR